MTSTLNRTLCATALMLLACGNGGNSDVAACPPPLSECAGVCVDTLYAHCLCRFHFCIPMQSYGGSKGKRGECSAVGGGNGGENAGNIPLSW